MSGVSQEGRQIAGRSWGLTETKRRRLKHTWTIHNFSWCYHKNGEALSSAVFGTEIDFRYRWQLMLYPNGRNEVSQDYISLSIYLHSCEYYEFDMSFRIGILNDKQEEVEICASSILDFMEEYIDNHDEFLRKSQLTEDKKLHLFPNDTLTVYCEIEMQTLIRNVLKPMQSHLVDDLETLLENGKFSDLTLWADGKAFQAHKAVLAARSPVFKAMFDADKVGIKNREIEIPHVNHQIMDDLLYYIYTNNLINLNKSASDLLIVAETYKLQELKSICEKALCEDLSVSNALERFILGDRHDAMDLKTKAKKYIYTYIVDVISTPGWKMIADDYPLLMAELLKME